jgi:D-sedoheptulose 7-phosphate isomerase
VRAVETARSAGARVLGIVGRDGGMTRAAADASVLIPPLFANRVTPHTEGLCAVVWHLLVSHPLLQRSGAKWESVSVGAKRA